MKINGLSKLSGLVAKAKFQVKKNAPTLLIVAGTTSVIGGTVMACKATIKAQDVVAELNDNLSDIKVAKEALDEGLISKETYSVEQYKKDIVTSYAKATMSMAKLYLPAALLLITGIGAMFASNKILKQRCASLSAAYATLDSMFKKYRKNVVEKYGEDVDNEMRYGIKKKKIEVETTDENGKTKKVKKEVEIIDDLKAVSDYARYFDEFTPYYQKERDGRPETEYNTRFIQFREREAQNRLERQGYLFLNDVYDMLGVEKSIAGQTVGWLYDPSDDNLHNHISFNLQHKCRANDRFVEGYEDCILLDFNVDGDITHGLNKKHMLPTK